MAVRAPNGGLVPRKAARESYFARKAYFSRETASAPATADQCDAGRVKATGRPVARANCRGGVKVRNGQRLSAGMRSWVSGVSGMLQCPAGYATCGARHARLPKPSLDLVLPLARSLRAYPNRKHQV